MTPASVARRDSREARLEKRLERERLARREVEAIAERSTRALYDKQRELVLLEKVVLASNESSTVDGALQGAVDAVCDHTGWPVGHAFVNDPATGHLVSSRIWHVEHDDRFTSFRRATEEQPFKRGLGLPGRVLESGDASWVTDVTLDGGFVRQGHEVRAGFAFPIFASGEIRAVLEFFTTTPVLPDPALLEVVTQIGRQLGRVVERVQAQEQIAHQAKHDALTGLANRFLFLDRLELALARAERHGSFAALLFLDLDRFKDVNDTLGHNVGDQLLRDVAGRLLDTLRASDTLVHSRDAFTLARFGGDEFVVLCEDLGCEGDAVRIAERVQRALLDPFVLERTEHVVAASIGIVLATGVERDAEALLRDADIAMYRAKERGAGNWEVFDEVLRERALERVATERALRSALDNEDLRLHYQPIVALDDGQIQSVEALVRWQRPGRGLVLPGEFIPIAEESALIVTLGAWILRRACEQARLWRDEYGDRAPLPVSVNVSARQLARAELPELIRQVLADTGVPAADLAIEVTETALIEDSHVPAASLRELRALGVKIWLDDFGTGYSSLSHLQRFPIDALKIDRSFVSDLREGGDNRAIVRAIAAMGSALGLEVVAEGVESAAQAVEVQALGCDRAQGYHFASPAPAAEIGALVRAPVV